MKLGFTGTRDGLTENQKIALKKLFEDLLYSIDEFHHGDCLGADMDAHILSEELQFHRIAKEKIFNIIIHPPEKDTLRAYCVGDETRDVFPYLRRNKNIVDETDILIACPKSRIEEQRSGTWSTVRYAYSKNKPLILLFPL